MNKLSIGLLGFLLFCNHALAQFPNLSTDEMVRKIEILNKSVTRKLNKLDKAIQKKISLTEVHYQDSASRPSEPKGTFLNNAVRSQLEEVREELKRTLSGTPPNLGLHKDLNATLVKIEKLLSFKGISRVTQLPASKANLVSAFTVSPDLKRDLQDLAELVETYKDQFKDWPLKLLNEITSLDELRMIREQLRSVRDYELLPEGYRQNLDGLQTNELVRAELEELEKEISKVGGVPIQEKLNEATCYIDKTKKKFVSRNSVENDSKRSNPYLGVAFTKRLRFGANFQIYRQRPTSLASAFRVSYVLGERSRLGIGLAYRFPLKNRAVVPNRSDVGKFRGRFFYNYSIFESVYAELLYELIRPHPDSIDNSQYPKNWKSTGMLGIGKRLYRSRHFDLIFTGYYLFFHSDKHPAGERLIFRLGLGF